MSETDHSLDSLLDLDNEIIVLSEDYWVKFEAKLVEESKGRPNCVKYSLTLHDKKGERVIGFDNSHRISGQNEETPYDHKHHIRYKNRVKVYNYINAGQLIEDFWKEVDDYLRDLL